MLCIAWSNYTKYILHFVCFNDIRKINTKTLELFAVIVYNINISYWYQLLIHLRKGCDFMTKKQRHSYMLSILNENPFLKDDELSRKCNVSISTIRNDRAELGIAEYRERIKSAAEGELHVSENKEELLDLTLYENGLSVLETDASMLFKNTNIVKSQCIYALAENLALSVINAKAALIKVANVKYTAEVHLKDKLVAKSTVKREKDNTYIVHVFINVDMKEVFRGKFNLEVVNN